MYGRWCALFPQLSQLTMGIVFIPDLTETDSWNEVLRGACLFV